jgi:hypothetical protein
MSPKERKQLEKLFKEYAAEGSPEGKKRILAKATKAMSKLSSLAATVASGGSIGQIMEGFSPKKLLEFYETQERVVVGFERMVERQKQFYEGQNNFFKAGFTGQMFDFSAAISEASKASLELNGNLAGADQVMRGFQSNSMALAVANEKFTKTLMNSAVVLERAGFEMDTFADIVDSAAFAFNKNEEEISGLTATLINVQKQIPVSGRKLAENFRFAQREFAYQSDRMMENFVGLQKMSTTTGVSFTDLAGAFGDSMDSFQGSAQMAGSLNQILGKSVFNSIELLNMTETERATKVRNAILQSGRSVEDMGKFELKALSKTLGFSVEDTRKFLRGDLKIDEADALKAIRSQNPSKMIMDNSKGLSKELDFLRDRVKSIQPPFDRFMISMSNATSDQALDRLDKFIGKLGTAGDMGLTSEQQIAVLQNRTLFMKQAKDRAKGAGTITGLGTPGEPALAGIIEKLGNTVAEKLEEINTQAGGDPKVALQLLMKMDNLTEKITQLISKAPSVIGAPSEP